MWTLIRQAVWKTHSVGYQSGSWQCHPSQAWRFPSRPPAATSPCSLLNIPQGLGCASLLQTARIFQVCACLDNVVFAHKDVCWLNVAMDDVILVEVLQTFADLNEVLPYHLLHMKKLLTVVRVVIERGACWLKWLPFGRLLKSMPQEKLSSALSLCE